MASDNDLRWETINCEEQFIENKVGETFYQTIPFNQINGIELTYKTYPLILYVGIVLLIMALSVLVFTNNKPENSYGLFFISAISFLIYLGNRKLKLVIYSGKITIEKRVLGPRRAEAMSFVKNVKDKIIKSSSKMV